MTQQPSPWTKLEPLPRASAGFVYGVLDHHLIVAGGTAWEGNVKLWLNDVYSIDLAQGHWQQHDALPAPLAYSGCVHDQHAIYVLGGQHDTHLSTDILRITTTGITSEKATLPDPLIYFGAGIDPAGRLYQIGSTRDASDFSKTTDAVIRIDPKTQQVNALAPYPGGPHILPATASTRNAIFVFGGASPQPTGTGITNRADAYAYSFAQATWRPLKPLPHARRGMSAVAINDDWILLVGGYGTLTNGAPDGFSDQAYLYSVKANDYELLAPLPYAASGMGLVKWGDQLVIFGGEDQIKHRTAAVYTARWPALRDAVHPH